MNNRKQWQKAVFSAFVIWTILLNSFPVESQDIVTSEDISGGSSVFVFRQSSKRSQAKSAFRGNTGRFQPGQRSDSRKKAREQALTASVTQRKRTPKIDPNAVAVNRSVSNTTKPGTKPGTTVPPIKTDTNQQVSIKMAGAGESFLDKNDFNSAISYFQQAVELDPKNENAKLGLSEALTRKGDQLSEQPENASAAFKLYQQAAAADPKNSAALIGLAGIYETLNESGKAIENYEKALAINPNLTEVYAPLGMLYFQKDEIAQADVYLTKASANNQTDQAIQSYLGQVRYKQNRNDEAIASFKQVLAANPNSAEAHYYLGQTYERLKRFDESFAEYDQATKINSNYVEAWFDLGAAYYNMNRYEDAVNAYKQVIRLKNDYGQAHANLADSYRQMAMESRDPKKKYELYGLANGEYQVASYFVKDDAELYSNWGFCLGRVAKWDTAIERLNTAVAISPDAADYTNIGWAYYNSAREDNNLNKLPTTTEQQKAANSAKAQAKLVQGKSALEKAIGINPKFVAAFLNLGITSTDLGDYQGAVTALKTAAGLWEGLRNPNKQVGIASFNELGLAYRQLNDLGNAVDQFKKVTGMDDKFAEGWYNLGEAEYRRGNKNEAKKAQEKLRTLNPRLADQLTVVISGMVYQGPQNKLQNKVQEKNPLNKIPKLPY